MVGNLHQLGYRLTPSGSIGDLTSLQQLFLTEVQRLRDEEQEVRGQDETSQATGGKPNTSTKPNRAEMKQQVREQVRQKELNGG